MGQTSSSAKVTSHDKAIFQLKLQRDKILQYQTKLSANLTSQTNIAKKCLADGQRDRAKLALKIKRYQETLISRTYEQLNTLEQLIGSIEFKLVEKNVLYGIKQGAETLRVLNQELSIENVEKIMDDSEEGIRYQEEISEMLGNHMSRVDEEDVELEFAALEKELSGARVKSDSEAGIKLPGVPSNDIKVDDSKSKIAKENEQEQEQEQDSGNTRKMEPLLA